MSTTQDTIVIVATHGRKRAKIVHQCLNHLLLQEPCFDILFIELVFDNGSSDHLRLTRNKRIKHIFIQGDDSNKGIFQKEPLYNIAIANCGDYKHLIFIDGDIYSEDANWISEIRGQLKRDPFALVSGFRKVTDTRDKDHTFLSHAYSLVHGNPNNLRLNPGLCWGANYDHLTLNGGFNPWGITGYGDSCFMVEYADLDQYDPKDGKTLSIKHHLNRFKWWFDNKRPYLKKGEIHTVEVDVMHLFHGKSSARNYWQKAFSIDMFNRSINELLFTNEKGLLTWRDCQCCERFILEESSRMDSLESVEIIIKKHYQMKSDIVHVINTSKFNSSSELRRIQDITVKSITTAVDETVTLIDCHQKGDQCQLSPVAGYAGK